MNFSSAIRKVALTAHLVSSVGWLGAVVCWMPLAVIGLTSENEQRVRACYLAMDLTAWLIIVPFAFASLLTGIVMSLGTAWGLFRHYWIVAKLLLTLFATAVLLLKMRQISDLATAAAKATLSYADLRQGRTELVGHAAGGVVVLVVITGLSVFKPWGLTRLGKRKQRRKDAV